MLHRGKWQMHALKHNMMMGIVHVVRLPAVQKVGIWALQGLLMPMFRA